MNKGSTATKMVSLNGMSVHVFVSVDVHLTACVSSDHAIIPVFALLQPLPAGDVRLGATPLQGGLYERVLGISATSRQHLSAYEDLQCAERETQTGCSTFVGIWGSFWWHGCRFACLVCWFTAPYLPQLYQYMSLICITSGISPIFDTHGNLWELLVPSGRVTTTIASLFMVFCQIILDSLVAPPFSFVTCSCVEPLRISGTGYVHHVKLSTVQLTQKVV